MWYRERLSPVSSFYVASPCLHDKKLAKQFILHCKIIQMLRLLQDTWVPWPLWVGNAFKTNGWSLSLHADRWPKAKVKGCKLMQTRLLALKISVRLQICKQSRTLQYLPRKTQWRKRSLLKSLAQDVRVFKGAFSKLNNRFLFWNVILELGVLFSLIECVTQSAILLWHTSTSVKSYFWQ